MAKENEKIMLENYVAPRTHLKNIKDISAQLKTHSEDTWSYECFQQLLKSSTQNHDHSNRVNPPRDVRKVHQHDLNLMSDLSEISKPSEENCDIDSLNPVLLDNMMHRRDNVNKLNGNGNKHTYFEKYHMIPK